MEILRNIVTVIYVINCLVLIALCLVQTKDDEGTVVEGSSSSFYEKNKSRTKEGRLKKWTIILGITFVVITVILGILYML